MKKVFTLLSFLLFSSYCHSQYSKEWTRPVSISNWPSWMVTDSSGYVYTFGDINRGIVNGHQIYYSTLNKFDPNGNLIWVKNFPDSGATTVSQTYFLPGDLKIDADNNLIALVVDEVNNTSWFIKTNLDGNSLWQTSLGMQCNQLFVDGSNNMYAVKNVTMASPGYWITKLSAGGNLIWSDSVPNMDNRPLIFKDGIFYYQYTDNLLTTNLVFRRDSSGIETYVYSNPSIDFNLIDVGVNELYTFDGVFVNVMDNSFNTLFSTHVIFCVKPYVSRDSIGNLWIVGYSYTTNACHPLSLSAISDRCYVGNARSITYRRYTKFLFASK